MKEAKKRYKSREKSNDSYAVSCLQRRKFYQTKSVGQKKKKSSGRQEIFFCAPSSFNIARTSFLRIMKLNFTTTKKRNQQKLNFNYNLKFPKGFSFIKKKKKISFLFLCLVSDNESI
ncbi:hypothetical protein ACKWTF_013665 [Chironomus riparius]